mgnify:FL=1
MYNEKKLHPITLVTAAYSRLVSFIWPIIFFAFSSSRLDGFGLILTVLSVTIFGLVYLADVLRFVRTTYWIEGNRFVVKSGLFVQNEKDVQITRIQSIDYSEDIVHRFFNATKLEIKTPGKGIVLDALSKENALQLANQLHFLKETFLVSERKSTTEPQIDRHSGFSLQKAGVTRTVYTMSLVDILKMNVMGGSVVKGFIVLVGAVNIFGELIPDALFNQAGTLVSQTAIVSILVLSIGVFLLLFFIGSLLSIIKNFEYKVDVTNNYLTIEKGLLEVKSQTIAVANIQSVWERQNWVQKLAGYTTFSVGITSDENVADKKDTSEATEKGEIILLPLVKTKQLAALRAEIVPQFICQPAQPVVPLRSWRRFIQVPLLIWISLSLVVSYILWPFAWIIGAVMSLLTLLYGYRSYKRTGYALSGSEITFQLPKFISTETVYLRRDRILNLTVKQTPFLKKSRLGKVQVSSALGDSAQVKQLSFIEEADCERIFDWFLTTERSQEHGTGNKDSSPSIEVMAHSRVHE